MGRIEKEPSLSTRIQYNVRSRVVQFGKCQFRLPDEVDFLFFLQSFLSQFSLIDEKNHYLTDPTHADCEFGFKGGLVGYLGYEMRLDVSPDRQNTAAVINNAEKFEPESIFLFIDRFILFDHEKQQVRVCALSDFQNLASARLWIDEIGVVCFFVPFESHIENSISSECCFICSCL